MGFDRLIIRREDFAGLISDKREFCSYAEPDEELLLLRAVFSEPNFWKNTTPAVAMKTPASVTEYILFMD